MSILPPPPCPGCMMCMLTDKNKWAQWLDKKKIEEKDFFDKPENLKEIIKLQNEKIRELMEQVREQRKALCIDHGYLLDCECDESTS